LDARVQRDSPLAAGGGGLEGRRGARCVVLAAGLREIFRFGGRSLARLREFVAPAEWPDRTAQWGGHMQEPPLDFWLLPCDPL